MQYHGEGILMDNDISTLKFGLKGLGYCSFINCIYSENGKCYREDFADSNPGDHDFEPFN